MSPELVKLLLEAGAPSALIIVVILMQWPRKEKSSNGNGVGQMQMQSLLQDVKGLSELLNDSRLSASRTLDAIHGLGERATSQHEQTMLVLDEIRRHQQRTPAA